MSAPPVPDALARAVLSPGEQAAFLQDAIMVSQSVEPTAEMWSRMVSGTDYHNARASLSVEPRHQLPPEWVRIPPDGYGALEGWPSPESPASLTFVGPTTVKVWKTWMTRRCANEVIQAPHLALLLDYLSGDAKAALTALLWQHVGQR